MSDSYVSDGKHVHYVGPRTGQTETPISELLERAREENRRLHRCIDMAMGCLDPNSQNTDERLAWYRLFDAQIGNGKEPRNADDLPPRD